MLLSAAYFMYECTKFQGAIQYREKTLSKCDMVIFTQPTVLHKKNKRGNFTKILLHFKEVNFFAYVTAKLLELNSLEK